MEVDDEDVVSEVVIVEFVVLDEMVSVVGGDLDENVVVDGFIVFVDEQFLDGDVGVLVDGDVFVVF